MATVANLLANPRAASNVTNYAAGPNSSGAPSQVADAAFPLGTAASETSTPANAATATGIYFADLTTSFLTVAAGDLIVVRLKVKVHAGANTPSLRMHLIFADSGGAGTGTYFGDIRDKCTVGTTSAAVYELIGFARAPASSARLSILVTQVGSTGSTTLRVSECLAYKLPATGIGLCPYADVTSTYVPPAAPDPSVLYLCCNDNGPNYAGATRGPEQWANDLAEMGVNACRWGVTNAMFSWPSVGAVPDFGPTRRWIDAQLAVGIKPIIAGPVPPAWVGNWVSDTTTYANYAKLCAAFAQAIPEAVAFDCFNEPNIGGTWTPAGVVSTADYVTLVQTVYPAVKAVAPNLPFLVGTTAAVGGTAGAGEVTADAFWSAIYAGVKSYSDGLALHPYTQRQTPTIPTSATSPTVGTRAMGLEEHIRIVRKYRDANSDTAKPLWLTEGGASSGTGFLSEADQGNYNRLMIETLRDRGRHPDIRCITTTVQVNYTADLTYGGGLPQIEAGTFRRKPSFAQVQAACGGARRPARRPLGAPVNVKRPVYA